MKHSLSIAYAVKRRAMKHKAAAHEEHEPMAESLLEDENQESPEQEMEEMSEPMSPAKHLALMIRRKAAKMADGGFPVIKVEGQGKGGGDIATTAGLGIDQKGKQGKPKAYADGGMVEDDPDADFLSDEEDDSGELDVPDDVAPEERRKGRLAAIMKGLHAKHFGRAS